MTHYTFKPAPTPAVCAVCGRPIRLTPYGWGHLVNPGRAHHYARPKKEATKVVSTDERQARIARERAAWEALREALEEAFRGTGVRIDKNRVDAVDAGLLDRGFDLSTAEEQ